MKKGTMVSVDGFFYAVESVENGIVRFRRPENSEAPRKSGSCREDDVVELEDEKGKKFYGLAGRE